MIERSEELKHFELRAVESVLDRNRGHSGTPRLWAALAP